MRYLIFATVLLCSFLTGAGTETSRQLSSEGEQAHFQPDLNLLRKRISEFWRLRMTFNRRQAVEYVEPESQDNFLNREPLPLKSFRILAIDLSDEDPRVVTVTVGATVQPAGIPRSLEWKVRDQYIYRDDNWFVVIPKPRLMEFFRSAEDRRVVGY